MELRSELVQLYIVDGQGSPSTYYTYDGYYNHKDRLKIRQKRRKIQQRTITSSLLSGFLTYYVSRKTNLPSFKFMKWNIPIKGLLAGFFGFVGGFILFDFIGTKQLAQYEQNVALNCHNLPLWKNKLRAVNPDRIFFQLIDSQDNQLSIFHSGLTPEAAANLVPDKVIGFSPEKPTMAGTHH